MLDKYPRLVKRTACWVATVGCALSFQSAYAATDKTAFVHLFEWKWNDIAKECEAFLGPKGFSAVQISPPNEHKNADAWWARYQPVSYKLDSHSGTQAELKSMIKRCNAVGVDIYADAVINHMADQNGTGTAGSTFGNKSFPDAGYTSSDFHTDCQISGSDYDTGSDNVQLCKLGTLPDLKTETSKVQNIIAEYLNALTDMGVAGFRFDAAKHMDPKDVDSIINKLDGNPYLFLEVIHDGGIDQEDYEDIADVTEFHYQWLMADAFKKNKFSLLTKENDLPPSEWGFMNPKKAVVFVDNHDSQREHPESLVTYQDKKIYELANVFMLAWPYGYPKVMSSFAFSSKDSKTPTQSVYDGSSNNCGDAWVCEHRWNAIANMVDFRRSVENESVDNFVTDNKSYVAFSRGEKGFVAINNGSNTMSQTFETGLPEGTYCEVLNSKFDRTTKQCDGSIVKVDKNGKAVISVQAYDAVAFYVGSECVEDSCEKSSEGSGVETEAPVEAPANNSSGGGAVVWFLPLILLGLRRFKA